MTDSQIRDRLRSAVDDTTAPPAFAVGIVQRGRARRRRRYAAGTIAAAVAITAGAALLPEGSTRATDGQVADGQSAGASKAGITWARALPEGPVPEVPFFGEGGLHTGAQVMSLPDAVNGSIAPRPVAGGWLVVTGQDEADLAYAVLAPDGSLRNLPAVTYDRGLGDVRMAVSPDGRRVALGQWVVDLESMQAANLPHAPEKNQQGGYYTMIRIIGFTDGGLVYEGAPFDQGIGTTWLLNDDGSTTKVQPPSDTHIPDGSPADVAVKYDYSDDESDTCITSFGLEGAAWTERGTGCLGRALGEALSVSPGGQWLLTDNLPQVWDLSAGRSASIDFPQAVMASWGDNVLGGAVWESGDSFLIPVADPFGDRESTGPYDQSVQVVRCTMSTGECERAGDEQQIVVRTDGMSTTGVRFAAPGR